MYFKRYWAFVDACSFPLSYVIHHYCKKYHTPAYGEVVIFMALTPFHFILYVPSVIFGMIVGIPVTLYKYYYTSHDKNDGSLENTDRHP